MYIQLNSQVLYYEKEGSGQPLLLLHGNGEDHSIFDALLPHLTPHYTVYSPDSRGCGLSSPSKEYHYADMVEDMKNLIVALEIGRPSILGFSDGGIVALLLAIRYPSLVHRLIVCGANLTPSGLTFFARRSIKAEYRKTKSELVKMMLNEPNISPAELGQIRAKTLVLAGEKDMVKEKETKKIASAIPNATLKIVPKADHGSYILHCDYLADDIIQFLG
ncbi:MAG: alpha/beta hydrolase [Lachnospiraceae bacterium]|nr:alpha/beta hydrolase [Lachnospiraceae bacterium]